MIPYFCFYQKWTLLTSFLIIQRNFQPQKASNTALYVYQKFPKSFWIACPRKPEELRCD
jgi:hypothetical protein